MADASRIDILRAEARYHRERYDLYRAKVYSQRPSSMVRLQELERAHQAAAERLRHAESELAASDRDVTEPPPGGSRGQA